MNGDGCGEYAPVASDDRANWSTSPLLNAGSGSGVAAGDGAGGGSASVAELELLAGGRSICAERDPVTGTNWSSVMPKAPAHMDSDMVPTPRTRVPSGAYLRTGASAAMDSGRTGAPFDRLDWPTRSSRCNWSRESELRLPFVEALRVLDENSTAEALGGRGTRGREAGDDGGAKGAEGGAPLDGCGEGDRFCEVDAWTAARELANDEDSRPLREREISSSRSLRARPRKTTGLAITAKEESDAMSGGSLTGVIRR
eukprot:TRINITY_DN13892_c0_g1_i1.p3 TRINITY_DN13892_c0_g1~~TRINITY_DN13892_c0_g1_i1.p3  ORF type:complete len:256 (+),score=-17.71 TRINITY_DN13892_c0_g1_i1:815-1582(+)